MTKAGFYRILCVVILGVFIAFSLSSEKEIGKTAPQIMEQIVADTEIKELTEGDISHLEEAFGIERADIDSFGYLRSEDIMNVRELAVIKVKEGVDAKKIADTVNKALEEKYNTYKDYDADAAAIIKSRTVKSRSGVVFCAVHESAAAAYEAFRKSLKN